MSSDISYTTEEISKLLKISKLTVYDLIKKGELPSYRVGKQMRVDAADLEAYKQRAKGALAADRPSVDLTPTFSPASFPSGSRSIVITGQDISLDILARHMEQQAPGIRPLRSYISSMDSLISLYRGESDIASTHLLDGDTGAYNLPYIRKLLVGSSYLVVNLLTRSAGFFVQSGNPLQLQHWSDLAKPGLRLVNREKGAGARVLLDEQLRLHHIKPGNVKGYQHVQTNHLSIAAKIASGEADVGIGTEKAAALVERVDFIPLIQEQYDLVMLKTPDNLAWIESLKEIVRSPAFKQELHALAGYDLTLTGQVLLET